MNRPMWISRSNVPRTVVLGSKFIDQHLIYRKLDLRDFKPKVYKIMDKRECGKYNVRV